MKKKINQKKATKNSKELKESQTKTSEKKENTQETSPSEINPLQEQVESLTRQNEMLNNLFSLKDEAFYRASILERMDIKNLQLQKMNQTLEKIGGVLEDFLEQIEPKPENESKPKPE